MNSFFSEFLTYVGRIREFDRGDWVVYVAWLGLMSGLCFLTLGFVVLGSWAGAPLPISAWLVPTGAFIFTVAISIDTIGHRTIYKPVLARAEGLVHGITIFCGVTSCVLLCAAFSRREVFLIPALVFTALSFVYSLVDEAFHWQRYATQRSDPVEMWSHVFILIGHGTMMAAWCGWCLSGYPGVAETVATLNR